MAIIPLKCPTCGYITEMGHVVPKEFHCPSCNTLFVIQPPARPKREEIHMATALLWASRSHDPRLKVGAVITDCTMKRILATGYNGVASGLPHDMVGKIPGESNCLHAEDNAIAAVDSTIPDKILFVTTAPCLMCAQRIINAGISIVYFLSCYRSNSGLDLLRETNIEVIQLASQKVSALLSMLKLTD